MSASTRIDDLLELDSLLTPEDIELRQTVRRFGEQRLRPHIAEWFETGEVPVRELASDLGKLGVLGMHLEGYGCGGSTATAYGLVCQELEAVDSGLRSLVSVQGSLAMFAIHKHGSEDQRKQWLPAMATGDVIGCFGLTEPDFGSNPGGMRTTARRDGSDWILNGSKMWITNGSVADIAVVWARAEEGILGFLVPAETAGFTASEMTHKMSLRASVTSELHLDDVRLPAEAQLPEARGLSGPLACLSEARFGIVFGRRADPTSPVPRAAAPRRAVARRRGVARRSRKPGATSCGSSRLRRIPCIGGYRKPRMPSSARAHTTAISATDPLVIHIFEPLRIQSEPSRRAVVRMPPGLEPKSGSVARSSR